MLKTWWLAFRDFLTLCPFPTFIWIFCLFLLSISHSILIPSLEFSLRVAPCPGREPQQARLANSPELALNQLLLEWTKSLQCFPLFLKCDNSMNTCRLFGDSPVLQSIRCPVAPPGFLTDAGCTQGLWLEVVCPHSCIFCDSW